MACPTNGPGTDPEVVFKVATTGSPGGTTFAFSALASPPELVKKYSENRVSKNSRSPILTSAPAKSVGKTSVSARVRETNARNITLKKTFLKIENGFIEKVQS